MTHMLSDLSPVLFCLFLLFGCGWFCLLLFLLASPADIIMSDTIRLRSLSKTLDLASVGQFGVVCCFGVCLVCLLWWCFWFCRFWIDPVVAT